MKLCAQSATKSKHALCYAGSVPCISQLIYWDFFTGIRINSTNLERLVHQNSNS